jgi:hypothetical protein
VAQGRPVHGRHPAALLQIVLDDAIDEQVVRLAVIVGVVGIKGEGESLVQLDALAGEVLLRARTG